MARIVYFLSFILFLFLLLASIVFVLRNDNLVAVDLLFIELSSLSVGFWLLASLVLGLILGLCLSLPANIFLRSTKKVNEKRLATTQSELSRLKRSPSKGS